MFSEAVTVVSDRAGEGGEDAGRLVPRSCVGGKSGFAGLLRPNRDEALVAGDPVYW